MVKCPSCGIEVEEGIPLCPNCATDVSNIKEEPEENLTSHSESVNICPNCGSEIDINAEFCSKCGTKIINEELNNNQDTFVNICPNCGAELEPDSKFCVNCGTHISKNINQDPHKINSINPNNTNTGFNIGNIDFGKLIAYSVVSLVLAIIISSIILYLLGYPAFGEEWPYYPIAFYIGTIVSVGFFAVFPKDKIEAGILGFIVGLMLFILENIIVSFVFTEYFARLYDLGYSGHGVGYIIVGVIIAVVSQLFLKEIITAYIKLDALF